MVYSYKDHREYTRLRKEELRREEARERSEPKPTINYWLLFVIIVFLVFAAWLDSAYSQSATVDRQLESVSIEITPIDNGAGLANMLITYDQGKKWEYRAAGKISAIPPFNLWLYFCDRLCNCTMMAKYIINENAPPYHLKVYVCEDDSSCRCDCANCAMCKGLPRNDEKPA